MSEPRLLVTASPHLRGPDTTPRVMWTVALSLVPVLAVASWFWGVSALLVTAASVLGAALPEALIGRKHSLCNSAQVRLTIPQGEHAGRPARGACPGHKRWLFVEIDQPLAANPRFVEIPVYPGFLAAAVHLPVRLPAPTVICCHGLLGFKDGSKYLAIADSLGRAGIDFQAELVAPIQVGAAVVLVPEVEAEFFTVLANVSVSVSP